VLEYFLLQLSSSCLYDTNEKTNDKDKGVPHVAAFQPFAIICALHAIFQRREAEFRTELKKHFAEIFSMLLTFLAVYTNVAPPTNAAVGASTMLHSETKEKSGKSKFGFSPNKDLVKQNPCQIVLDTFRLFLDNLQMEQVSSAFNMCPHLGSSLNLGNFIEILTPLSVGLVNHLPINSSALNEVVTVLAKYIPSPYDGQRIAAIGMYAQLVALRPCGEISSVIVLHLSSSLNDPNPLVRGICIRGLSFVGNLSEHDSNKYSEISLAALLKGIDESNRFVKR
jgi:maestro heat-like repeat-containing protein family member 1